MSKSKKTFFFLITFHFLLIGNIFPEKSSTLNSPHSFKNADTLALLKKLPNKEVILSKITALAKYNKHGAKNELFKERIDYYRYLIFLIDEIEEITFLKNNVQKDFENILNEIKIEKDTSKAKFFTHEDYQRFKNKFEKGRRIVKEKEVILSNLQFEKEILKDKLKNEKGAIRKIQVKQKDLEFTRNSLNKENEFYKDKSKKLKQKLSLNQELKNILQGRIGAYGVHLDLLLLKETIAKFDKKSYGRLKSHYQNLFAKSKQKLIITNSDLDELRIHVEEKRSQILNNISALESKSFFVSNRLKQIKRNRNETFQKISRTKDPATKKKLKNAYAIINININFLRAKRKFLKTQKYFQQFKYELSLSKLQLMELLALKNIQRLSIEELNLRAANLSKKLKTLHWLNEASHKQVEGLNASINTMNQMVIDFKAGDNINTRKIQALTQEIKIKSDFLRFLRQYQALLNEYQGTLEELSQFIEKRTGFLKFFVKNKTRIGMMDLFILSSIIFILLLWIYLKKDLLSFHKRKISAMATKYLFIIYPGLGLLFLMIGLGGYNRLYVFLYWSLFKSVLVIYLSLWLIGKSQKKIQDMESVKSSISGIEK